MIEDLKLEGLTASMRQAFEFQLTESVDQAITQALTRTLKKEDWKVYEDYRKMHPDDMPDKAIQAMTEQSPATKKAIEEALFDTYKDVMLRAEAVREELKSQKTNA